MARNHSCSDTWVEAKIVPAIGEVCRRQALQWNSPRDLTAQYARRRPGIRSHSASGTRSPPRGISPRINAAVASVPFLTLLSVSFFGRERQEAPEANADRV